MVRAVISGAKTQTRRIASTRQCVLGEEFPGPRGSDGFSRAYLMHRASDRAGMLALCPYGQPGDRLWVREAWRTVADADRLPPRNLTTAHRIWHEADEPHQPGAGKYRPPMFMPRWASRVTLALTGVRIERLQDISEADAMAEGSRSWALEQDTPVKDIAAGETRLIFRQLWEQINGPDSWDANPWVWVVEFRRLP